MDATDLVGDVRIVKSVHARVFGPLFIASMGLAAFLDVASSPRFATFHTIDVVHLMASVVRFWSGLPRLRQTFRHKLITADIEDIPTPGLPTFIGLRVRASPDPLF